MSLAAPSICRAMFIASAVFQKSQSPATRTIVVLLRKFGIEQGASWTIISSSEESGATLSFRLAVRHVVPARHGRLSQVAAERAASRRSPSRRDLIPRPPRHRKRPRRPPSLQLPKSHSRTSFALEVSLRKTAPRRLPVHVWGCAPVGLAASRTASGSHAAISTLEDNKPAQTVASRLALTFSVAIFPSVFHSTVDRVGTSTIHGKAARHVQDPRIHGLVKGGAAKGRVIAGVQENRIPTSKEKAGCNNIADNNSSINNARKKTQEQARQQRQ